MLELEVRYPEQILESANGQGYMFRVDIGASSSEADLKSDAFSKEPNTDTVLSSQSTRLLPLQVRKRSINPFRQDGVCFQEAETEAGEQFHGSSAS